MAHATVFTQCQALAGGLQLLLAGVVLSALRQTLRSLLMGTGHTAVALNVFLGMGIKFHVARSGRVRGVGCMVGMLVRPNGIGQGQSGHGCAKQRFHSVFR
jgi:hypothetical protein